MFNPNGNRLTPGRPADEDSFGWEKIAAIVAGIAAVGVGVAAVVNHFSSDSSSNQSNQHNSSSRNSYQSNSSNRISYQSNPSPKVVMAVDATPKRAGGILRSYPYLFYYSVDWRNVFNFSEYQQPDIFEMANALLAFRVFQSKLVGLDEIKADNNFVLKTKRYRDDGDEDMSRKFKAKSNGVQVTMIGKDEDEDMKNADMLSRGNYGECKFEGFWNYQKIDMREEAEGCLRLLAAIDVPPKYKK